MKPNFAALITALSDDDLERFVGHWLKHRVKEYHSHERWSGLGDMGRDVVGYTSPEQREGPWDNFQCKRLTKRLGETSVFVELGKYSCTPRTANIVFRVRTRSLLREVSCAPCKPISRILSKRSPVLTSGQFTNQTLERNLFRLLVTGDDDAAAVTVTSTKKKAVRMKSSPLYDLVMDVCEELEVHVPDARRIQLSDRPLQRAQKTQRISKSVSPRNRSDARSCSPGVLYGSG